MWHSVEYGWGGMGLGMLLFWVILLAVIVALVRFTMGPFANAEHKREKSALEILKERYAKGEIGREEFEQIKSDLQK